MPVFLRSHNINFLTSEKTDIRATIAVEIPHNGLQFKFFYPIILSFRDLKSVISVFNFPSLKFSSVSFLNPLLHNEIFNGRFTLITMYTPYCKGYAFIIDYVLCGGVGLPSSASPGGG